MSLNIYNKILLEKRGWISKIPENKKAVMLISGGYDSIVTAARLIKDFDMELFPIYFDRGSRNREAELSSVKFYEKYLRELYGEGKFHSVVIPKVHIPPKEFKDNLQEYAMTHSYPMRDTIMMLLAVQYAASLKDNVRTICNGMLTHDFEMGLEGNRLATLAICDMTKENDWNILSLNIDNEISSNLFGKSDVMKWAHKNHFDDSKTVTCWTPIKVGDEFFHCGRCAACKERQDEFKKAQIVDTTKYFN